MADLISPPSRSEIYADLDLRLLTNPLSDDLVVLKDLEAVKQSVLRLVLTNYYEIPFEPFKGANVSALLFEPADEFTAFKIQENIVRVLRNYEPRIRNIRVTVRDESEKNAYTVSIQFTIIAYNSGASLSFSLKRLR